MSWINYTKRKPSEDKEYLVAYGNPYGVDFSYGISHSFRGSFRDDKRGGNHIIFWRDLPTILNTDKHFFRIAYNKEICGLK